MRCGAFSGYTYGSRYAYIKNCFATGIPTSITEPTNGGLLGSSMGAVSNCYYRNDIEKIGVTSGTAISLEEMKTEEFAAKLGDAFVAGKDHPVLKWSV